MEMKKDTREFLLKDWEAAHKSRETYASMRVGILGACLTILGLVVSLGKDATYPSIIGVWTILLLSPAAGIRMLAAVDRAIYIFFSYMATLEAELGEVGFAACWTQYVKKNARYTASKAFRVAMRLMNLAVSLLVTASAVGTAMTEQRGIHHWIGVGYTVTAALSFLYNEFYIGRQLDPSRFIPRIEDDLRKIRESLIASRWSAGSP
jgi:hypothetical protein